MSELDLDAIETRAKAATPGPWKADTKYASSDFGLIVGGDLGFARDGVPDGTTWKVAYVCYDNGDRPEDEDRSWYDEEDAEFIAHAREDVPALIAELRRLREENARLKEPRIPRGVELRCDDCQQPYAVWFAPNETWNFVMGGADCKGDPGGMLCPRCFTLRAEAAGVVPTAWEVRPERLADGEWIPVTESLPEEGLDVLVWWYGSHLRIGHYNGRDKSFVAGRYYAPDVTHWRPLPKPPEVGK